MKPPKRIIRYAVWDRPQELETVVELAARALYENAGYEVLHKTKIGASAPLSMRDKRPHHFIKLTFEEEET